MDKLTTSRAKKPFSMEVDILSNEDLSAQASITEKKIEAKEKTQPKAGSKKEIIL